MIELTYLIYLKLLLRHMSCRRR